MMDLRVRYSCDCCGRYCPVPIGLCPQCKSRARTHLDPTEDDSGRTSSDDEGRESLDDVPLYEGQVVFKGDFDETGH